MLYINIYLNKRLQKSAKGTILNGIKLRKYKCQVKLNFILMLMTLKGIKNK